MNKKQETIRKTKFKHKEKNHTKKMLTNRVATNQQVKYLSGLKFNLIFYLQSLVNNIKALVLIRHFFRETRTAIQNH